MAGRPEEEAGCRKGVLSATRPPERDHSEGLEGTAVYGEALQRGLLNALAERGADAPTPPGKPGKPRKTPKNVAASRATSHERSAPQTRIDLRSQAAATTATAARPTARSASDPLWATAGRAATLAGCAGLLIAAISTREEPRTHPTPPAEASAASTQPQATTATAKLPVAPTSASPQPTPAPTTDRAPGAFAARKEVRATDTPSGHHNELARTAVDALIRADYSGARAAYAELAAGAGPTSPFAALVRILDQRLSRPERPPEAR